MQLNPLLKTSLWTFVLGLAALVSSIAAPPALPALRSDGKYTISEKGKSSELRVVFTEVLKTAAPGLDAEVIQIEGVTTLQELKLRISELELTSKRKFAPIVKVDGQSGSVSRDVVVTCPSAISLTQLAAFVGATKAYRLSFSPETIIVEFSGATDALNGAEALAKIVGVQSAKPSLALNNKRARFIPNDIYYPQRPAPNPPPFPGYCWHLKNVEFPVIDVNVQPAWDISKGDGIQVAVLDDGLEFLHEDLKANALGAGGYDFVENDINPTAGEHGTCVAGLIGARGNNKIGSTGGMVGSAMNCKMFGLRILGSGVTDEETARALGWSLTFHVSNNSWGFTEPYEQTPILDTAIKYTAQRGRSGRGAIFMFASGNTRDDNHWSTLYGMQNLIESNTIAAINDAGVYVSYSTPGPDLLCAAPSGETVDDSNRMLTTTDRSGVLGYNPPEVPAFPGVNFSNRNYTNTFNGTSGSCPIASGVVALMIKAKSSLGWRDVQDIIMRTSKHYGSLDFQTRVVEGVVYSTSHDVGAGMIDAGAAVARAKTAKLLGAAYDTDYSITIDAPIPDGSPAGVTRIFRVPNAPRVRCEKIQLTVETDHPKPSALRVLLNSPGGRTYSIMQPSRPTFNRPNSWTYVSTQHWGECSGGEWSVSVADPVAGGGTGKLLGATVKIFGGAGPRPTAVPVITNTFLPDGYENCQYYAYGDGTPFYITTTGCPQAYFADGLPKGLAVDSLTGQIKGKPTEDGVFVVTLRAKNEIGMGSLVLNMTVLPQIPAPFLTGGFLGVATVGEPFRLQLFTNPTLVSFVLQITNGGVSDGLLYYNGTGLIVGTPTTAGLIAVDAQLSNYCGVSNHKIYILVQEAAKSLSEAMDVPGTPFQVDSFETDTWRWSNGGDGFGGDTARSPVVKIGESTNFSTVVTGPVDVSFDWSSSHAAADTTTFSVLPDPVVPGSTAVISGITPWTHHTVSLGAGTFTLQWEYTNNTLTLGGEEISRIDHLVLNYPDLPVALDIAPPGTVSSFGTSPWIRETTDTSDGVDAAKSATGLPDSGSSSMEISVTGPGTLSWKWKVSSLVGDILSVSMDGGPNLLEMAGNLAPESVWNPASIAIPAGDHVVRWTYKKDDVPPQPGDPVVLDAGFVDAVVFTP